MLNVLIIEDNLDELNYCCNAINRILEKCNIIKATNGEEACVLMNQKRVDIFFIDVELPGINGFQLAEKIRQNMNYRLTNIVFITGYKANQLSIHKKYHHYEYIEKPYTLDSFEVIVGPLIRELDLQKRRNVKNQVDSKKKMILVETKDETVFVNLEDILYVETQGRNLLLHTKKQSIEDVKMTIDDMIQAVNNSLFVRCHKSYAIHIKNVKSIKSAARRLWHADFGYGSYNYCLVSKNYYNNVYRLFEGLIKGLEV